MSRRIFLFLTGGLLAKSRGPEAKMGGRRQEEDPVVPEGAPQDSDARPRSCSFCRQEFQEARGLVDGPDGVAICIACLGRCMESVRFRNAYCSFCRRNYRDVGPLVEGPNWVYICGDCIKLCGQVLDQEQQRRATAERSDPADPPAAGR